MAAKHSSIKLIKSNTVSSLTSKFQQNEISDATLERPNPIRRRSAWPPATKSTSSLTAAKALVQSSPAKSNSKSHNYREKTATAVPSANALVKKPPVSAKTAIGAKSSAVPISKTAKSDVARKPLVFTPAEGKQHIGKDISSEHKAGQPVRPRTTRVVTHSLPAENVGAAAKRQSLKRSKPVTNKPVITASKPVATGGKSIVNINKPSVTSNSHTVSTGSKTALSHNKLLNKSGKLAVNGDNEIETVAKNFVHSRTRPVLSTGESASSAINTRLNVSTSKANRTNIKPVVSPNKPVLNVDKIDKTQAKPALPSAVLASEHAATSEKEISNSSSLEVTVVKRPVPAPRLSLTSQTSPLLDNTGKLPSDQRHQHDNLSKAHMGETSEMRAGKPQVSPNKPSMAALSTASSSPSKAERILGVSGSVIQEAKLKLKNASSTQLAGDVKSEETNNNEVNEVYKPVGYDRQMSAFLKMKEQWKTSSNVNSHDESKEEKEETVKERPALPPRHESVVTQDVDRSKPSVPTKPAFISPKGLGKKKVLLPPPDDSQQGYDGVVLLSKEDNCPIPSKPPRTFAHDVYVQQKGVPKTVDLQVSADLASSSGAIVNSHDEVEAYEVVDVVGNDETGLPETGVRVTLTKTKQKDQRKTETTSASGTFVVRDRDDNSIVHVSKHDRNLPASSFVSKKRVVNPSYEKNFKTSTSYEYVTPTPQRTAQYYSGEQEHCDHFEQYSDPLDMLVPADVLAPVGDKPGSDTKDRDGTTLRLAGYDHNNEGVVFDFEGYATPLTRQMSNSAQVKEKVHNAFMTLYEDWDTASKRKGQHIENDDEAENEIEEDDDSSVDCDEHNARINYLKALREREYECSYRWLPPMSQHSHMFSYFAIVGLEVVDNPNDSNGSQIHKPNVILSYPVKDKSELDMVAQFSYPDVDLLKKDEESELLTTYSFVMTNITGNRSYGYCRRLPLAGRSTRHPEVLCIVSTVPAYTLYCDLLDHCARHYCTAKINDIRAQMKILYEKPLPQPGESIVVENTVTKQKPFMLTRNLSNVLEKADFSCLYKHFTTDVLLRVFSAMLMEQRILIVSKSLCNLSSCITALSSLLYPYIWQHTYIPVLPAKVIEVCCAPTPFIIGILSHFTHKVQDLPMDEHLLVDIDSGTATHSSGTESSVLPKRIKKALTNALNNAEGLHISQLSETISESFLHLFVETTGHYTECVYTVGEGEGPEERVFQQDIFCKILPSKSIRMFLECFVQTQMFNVFISDRLEGVVPMDGYFEKQVEIYRDEMATMSPTLKENLKDMRKKMKKFMRGKGVKIKRKLKGTSNEFV